MQALKTAPCQSKPMTEVLRQSIRKFRVIPTEIDPEKFINDSWIGQADAEFPQFVISVKLQCDRVIENYTNATDVPETEGDRAFGGSVVGQGDMVAVGFDLTYVGAW
jgi:hypothetical protein